MKLHKFQLTWDPKAAMYIAILFFLAFSLTQDAVAQSFWVQTNGPSAGPVRTLAIDKNGAIFAGTDGGGVFRTTDNGNVWTAVNNGLTNLSVQKMVINVNEDIFAGTYGGGVFRSTNNGGSWTAVNTGLTDMTIRSLVVNMNGEIFAGANEVFRSNNNGANWTSVSDGLGTSHIEELAINPSGHLFAGTSGFDGASGEGMFRSTNNGANWTAINNGLMSLTIFALTINSKGHIFAGTDVSGVFRSTNSGNNWIAVNSGLTNLAAFVLISNTVDYVFAGTNGGGIFRSTDNGVSWVEVNSGLSQFNLRSFGIDASGFIFAGTSSGAVFRSRQSTLPPPLVTTAPATNVTSASSTLNGMVNPNALNTTVKFQYGLSTSYGNEVTAAPNPVMGTSVVAVSAAIAGLSPGSTYHYRIVATNVVGTTNGLDGTFITLANPLPTLTSINPLSGAVGKTLDVVFTGTNFIPSTTVNPGAAGINVNSVMVNSSTSLTANLTITAAASPGPRSFSVTNPGLGGGTSNALTFTVTNLSVTSIAPISGNRLQRLNVVFTGTGFVAGATVNVGTGITKNSVTVTSATSLTADLTIAATADTGARNFSVTNPNGETSNDVVFTVNNPAPTLTSIAPSIGNRLQTLDVVFTGANFISGVSALNLGAGIIINAHTVNSSTSLTANIMITANAATGVRSFSITNSAPGGGTSTGQNFTVNNPVPTLSSISPASSVLGQTLDVVFTGASFLSGATTPNVGGLTLNTFTVTSANSATANITIPQRQQRARKIFP